MAEQNWAGIYKALGYVHNTYGADIVTEPLKIRSLLLDLAPTAKKEINIFINILSEQDIIRRIRASTDVNASFVAQQIENATGLSTESAVNATKALMIVMGKKDTTSIQLTQTKQKQQITNNNLKPVPQSVKRHRKGNKIEGRLATDPADIMVTYNSSEQFLNPIDLKMPNNTIFKFDLIETFPASKGDYLIVARDEGPNAVIFFVFKNPEGTATPPVLITTGKNMKKLYRSFMDSHSGKYEFTDASEMQPKIQPRKSDLPREFTESTAQGMFGPYLREVVEIPAKYASIGSNVFRYAYTSYKIPEISKLVIPESVTKIDIFAFYDVRILEKVVIPDSVTNIGILAFNLNTDAYIECSENSYAYTYARDNKLRNSVDIKAAYRNNEKCQYCGGEFEKKLFQNPVCRSYRRTKDY